MFAALAPTASCTMLTEAAIDRGQVAHVDVLAWPNLVEVGDTLTVSADGYTAAGIYTAWIAPRVWTLSDSSALGIRGTGIPGRAELRGLRPGTVRVSARIGDSEGSDTVRVVPRLAPVTFTPSAVSMRLGDSVQVAARILTTTGDPIAGVTVRWSTNDIGVVSTSCCSASTWLYSRRSYGTTGTTTVTATVGHATGVLPVTVTP
jgi:hypothetical protein